MSSARANELLEQAGGYYRQDQLDQAVELARRALKQHRTSADAYQLLGLIAMKRGVYPDAVAAYKKASSLDPKNDRYLYLQAKALTTMGRIDDALHCFDLALALNPQNAEMLGWKAIALERGGRIDEAYAIIEPFVSEARDDELMGEVAARVHQQRGEHDRAIAGLDRHLARTNLHPLARHVMSFLRAQSLDRLDRLDDAMNAYAQANRVLAVPFDRDAFARDIDEIIRVYSRETVAKMPRAHDTSDWPVIIAGFPRSGTTLLERVLHAHPAAAGAGELDYFREIEHELASGAGPAYPGCALSLDARQLGIFAWQYRQRLAALGSKAERVVDKSLHNWRLLGLLLQVLPGARFIWCQREPMDICISCYTRELMPGRHPFVTDLANLGFTFGQHQRLMRHWLDVLDVPILEVRYEGLVEDLESETRRVLSFIGLGFDENCLRFHESSRRSTTLSYDQVRQPIYRSSLARWKRYEPYLGPLRDELERAGVPLDEG